MVEPIVEQLSQLFLEARRAIPSHETQKCGKKENRDMHCILILQAFPSELSLAFHYDAMHVPAWRP